jgi:peptide chain release factor 3
LLQEGVVQSFLLKDSAQRVPLLGAVGPLQFEVVQYRMQTEYGAESRLESCPWKVVRWVVPEPGNAIDDTQLPTGARLAFDAAGTPVLLFQDEWSCNFYSQRNPKVALSAVPLEARDGQAAVK